MSVSKYRSNRYYLGCSKVIKEKVDVAEVDYDWSELPGAGILKFLNRSNNYNLGCSKDALDHEEKGNATCNEQEVTKNTSGSFTDGVTEHPSETSEAGR